MVSKSPQELKQLTENEILRLNKFVPTDPTDDHLAHIITMGDEFMNEAQIIHRMEHIDAYTHSNQQT